MDQAKINFNQKPLNLRITRSHECAYLENRAEQRLAADISEAPSVDDLPDTWDDDFDPSLLVCVSVCISIRTVVL